MFMVTTMSLDELGTLIRDKQVSLDNGSLLFGSPTQLVDTYFKNNVGYSGYVVGLRGRLNKTTANLFATIDTRVNSGDRIILEAEIDENDVVRYNINGINAAAEALTYGLGEADIEEQLDTAQKQASDPAQGVEVLCVPFIKANGKVRVTSLTDQLTFDVEGITFVRLK